MKKFSILGLLFLCLVAVLAMTTAPAAAQAIFTEFTGAEIVVDLIYPGDITFPGGTFERIHGRGRIWEMRHETTDPRVTGTAIVVSNGNFDEDFSGPAWGTFQLQPDVYDGFWEARWQSPPGRPNIISAVGHGTGELDGLTAWWTFDYSEDPMNGQITGRILDPHGQ